MCAHNTFTVMKIQTTFLISTIFRHKLRYMQDRVLNNSTCKLSLKRHFLFQKRKFCSSKSLHWGKKKDITNGMNKKRKKIFSLPKLSLLSQAEEVNCEYDFWFFNNKALIVCCNGDISITRWQWTILLYKLTLTLIPGSTPVCCIH